MEPKAEVDCLTVDISEVMQSLELTVTGFKVMSFRWAVASVFFKLGALIAGCHVNVATSDEVPEDAPDDGRPTPPPCRYTR